MEAFITIFGVIGLAIILILYGSISWGYVTHTFYSWFILTSFPDLPNFSIIQFIGFSMFISTIIRGNYVSIKDEYRDKNSEYIIMFIMPWVTLLIGWVVKVLLF